MNKLPDTAASPAGGSKIKTTALLLLVVTPVVTWGVFGLLGHRITSAISSRYGPQILARGDGKFTDAQTFVEGRLKEGLILLTAACILVLVHMAFFRLAARRFKPPASWIVQAWSAFICLNIFVGISGNTALFWCLLYTGKDHSHNYTQWRIKQSLMKEIHAPAQAVLLGASQTRAQIDSKILNDRLGQRLWTTELHFPGSDPYETTLCLKRIANVRLDFVIVYVSEYTVYGGSDNGRLIFFFGLRDLKDYLMLGPGKPSVDRFLICGLLGDIFPIYRDWEPLMTRFKGWEAANQNQKQYDAALDTNLVHRAQDFAKDINTSSGQTSSFNKKEFEALAEMCQERNSRLVICCGQLNPILERDLDPKIRMETTNFLHHLADKYANVVLLDRSQFPAQTENDYEDLTHVNLATRARFSESLADALEKILEKRPL